MRINCVSFNQTLLVPVFPAPSIPRQVVLCFRIVLSQTRDGQFKSGYPLTISAEIGIRIRWRVSVRIPALYWWANAGGGIFFCKKCKEKKTLPPSA
jgi:hypothetical protein